ncbi:MAG: InlB B-repeat-containing protein, partial [Bacteroidales bacterium]|nr:InlB B-repeat-containing protein [Bacteroidales bacterium]
QPTEAEGVYAHFTELTVLAEASEGNEFRYWVIDGENVNGTATLTLTVDGPKTVEAFFTPLRKQLTVVNPYEERGTVTGDGLYEHGAAAELTANAAFGYVFTNWTDEDGETYTANPLLIDALTENRTLTVHFEAMPFDLCISNPTPELGDYTVNGETAAEHCLTFPYLQTVTLAATPAADKRFVGWKNAETDELLTDNPLQLTMRADLSLTAEFDNAVYTVQGAAYPTEAAYITGCDDYYLDATAKLTATPRFGFTFTGWYDEQGERLGENLNYEFHVEKAVYYVARFERNLYTLNVVATDGGTVAGGGKRPYGYNTKVEALPEEGRQFNGWFDAQGTLVSDEAVYYPTVLKDETLTAQFGPKALNIVLSCEPAEAGTIKRLGQADAGFFYNQAVTFQAQPTDVYTFSHWTDANDKRSENADLTLRPTTDLHLTAHFTLRAFQTADISVQPANAGQLANLPENWIYGQSYTVSVNQTDDRYTFIGWTDAEGKTRSTEMSYTFTFDHQPRVAQFEAKAVAVNIACEPAQAGHVTLTGEPRYFETVTLNPQAARGYRFAAWRNAQGETLEGTAAELTWTLDGDLSLTAVFEPETYDILVAAVPEAGGLIAGPATAAYGSTVTLTATANDGYTFQAYEDAEGKAVSYEPAFTTTVNGPLNLHARFAPRSYTLLAVPADKTLGQTKGSGLFAFGETVTVKAWPMAAGYTFSHWSADPQGNDRLSEEAEYQYTMTAENRTIYACFKLQTLQLELTANLPQAGTLQGGGEKTYGETVTVSATANEGYIWQGFSEYDVLTTEETSWTFTMTENRHIVGVFAPMMWQITAVDVPEGVKVKGTGEAAHGTQAEIEAVLPNTLDFVAWVDAEGNPVGTNNPLRVTVQNDLQLTPRCTPHLLPLSVT